MSTYTVKKTPDAAKNTHLRAPWQSPATNPTYNSLLSELNAGKTSVTGSKPASGGSGSSGAGGGTGAASSLYYGNGIYGGPTGIPDYRTYTPKPTDIQDISALVGGLNYDENKIKGMFDAATKAEYENKRAANIAAQREFATNSAKNINTLSDTMRQSLNQAVATGGSRGVAAAQAMQAALGASQQTIDEASKLAEDNMNLKFAEAEAYTKNAKDAEALRYGRQQDALNMIMQRLGYDTQSAVGAMSADADARGSKLYGLDAAERALMGTIYNTDGNYRTEVDVANIGAQTDRDIASTNAMLDAYARGIIEKTPELAAALGVSLDALKEPPATTGSSSYGGSYGGGGSGGGYAGGGFDVKTPTDYNVESYRYALPLAREFYNKGDLEGWAGALGVPLADADEMWRSMRGEEWNYVQSHTEADAVKWLQRRGYTKEQATKNYKLWKQPTK